jgi:hypothetical protein
LLSIIEYLLFNGWIDINVHTGIYTPVDEVLICRVCIGEVFEKMGKCIYTIDIISGGSLPICYL